MQRYNVTGSFLRVVQGEVWVLKPAMTVYDSGMLPLNEATQRGNCAGVGERWVKWVGDVRMKSLPATAPSADTGDTYAVDRFLGRIVTGLECHHRNRMTEADQFAGESLYVPFETPDYGSIEVA
jgi:hypothetical protein